MPELPEVETVKEGLKVICKNRYIVKSQIHTYQLRYPIPKNLSHCITSSKIVDLKRRAKYLIFKLSSGYLLLHLGMAGRMYVSQEHVKDKHEHLTLYLDDGNVISFCDPRRFGAVIWTSSPLDEHPIIQKLGIEPFSQAFQVNNFHNTCSKRKFSIKQLLMEGRAVAGIGNIYASEILFHAGIRPTRAVNTLSLKECEKIHKHTKSVLTKAIRAGGTTIRDFKNPKNELGYFAQQLSVYGRLGQKCIKCNQSILKITQNQRSSFYCPKCQI